jgi:hypothetical protein
MRCTTQSCAQQRVYVRLAPLLLAIERHEPIMKDYGGETSSAMGGSVGYGLDCCIWQTRELNTSATLHRKPCRYMLVAITLGIDGTNTCSDSVAHLVLRRVGRALHSACSLKHLL